MLDRKCISPKSGKSLVFRDFFYMQILVFDNRSSEWNMEI